MKTPGMFPRYAGLAAVRARGINQDSTAASDKRLSKRVAFAVVGLLAIVAFMRALILGVSVLGSILMVAAIFALVAGVAFVALAVHRNLLGGHSPDR